MNARRLFARRFSSAFTSMANVLPPLGMIFIMLIFAFLACLMALRLLACGLVVLCLLVLIGG